MQCSSAMVLLTKRYTHFRTMRTDTLLLAVFILFVGFKTHSQTSFNTEANDSSNIYLFSLTKYCEYLDNSGNKESTVYVEKDDIFTNDLPNRIKSHEIRYFEMIEVKNYLKGKKGIILVRIIPLRVKANDFFVNVIPFSVSYDKKKFHFINGGGLGVKFQFDQGTNGLIYKSVEIGWI